VGKTTVAYVKFLPDAVCQKLTKSTNVSRNHSKNKRGMFFIETRCIRQQLKKIQVFISTPNPFEVIHESCPTSLVGACISSTRCLVVGLNS